MKWLSGVLLLLMLAGCGSESSKNHTPVTGDDENTTLPVDEPEEPEQPETPDCVTYPESVLNGKALYEAHCILCHNKDAKSGYMDIRGMSAEEITWAVNNIVNMRDLGLATILSTTDMISLQDYLAEIMVNPEIADYEGCTPVENNATLASVGSRLFFDTNLSLRGNQACATCHNPSHAFTDSRFLDPAEYNPVSGAFSVGDDNLTLGGRNAPTAAYAALTPAFIQLSDGNFSGGFFHDGRATTLKDQAKGPFLNPAEMMMPDAAAVVARVVSDTGYVRDLKALFGESIFDDTDAAYDAVAQCIAAYESTETFSPFDSKYDRSKLDPSDPDHYAMTPLEAQGYALFFSEEAKCAQCHTINSSSEKATGELFTNAAYENIGTPKNLAALMIRDGHTDALDRGLGERTDINDSTHYGKFKVPTLRNIAVTGPYMHNGVFQEFRTVLEFYDHMTGQGSHPLNPETNTTWEAPEVNATVNYTTLEAMSPFSESDIDALEAFLKTLTDARYEALLP